MLKENPALRNKYDLFETRLEAGEQLNEFIEDEIDLILAIPNGGVPVAKPLIEKLKPPEFNLLLIRKVHVPWTREAGMGAVTPDGDVFFNKELIRTYQIQETAIEKKVKDAIEAIEKRKKEFELTDYSVESKTVLITDDGIASGFSMIAGSTWLRDKGAKKIIIAVPTAPLDSMKKIEDLVDEIICLNVRTKYPFAVADAYKNWYDVPSIEVKKLLEEIKEIMI
ncbi:MAG: phosphoribosyltransferase [Candidatus Heimdallarchaeaceae archaeon]